MISVVHKHGTSFKGLSRYLYHDIDADTSERVAWVATHKLGTDDPDIAWKAMLATAAQQDALKAQAGVPNTGRKSKSVVMHYSLSWHPDETEELTRDEMLSAALASMTNLGTREDEYLGKNKRTGQEIRAKRTQLADEHQAVIVCHVEDDKAPHVHIMLNRVHPEHGVMLPSSKDFEKLSAWALDYRRAQGREDYCPKRIQNAARRAEGYATSCPRKNRQAYETEQARSQADPRSKTAAALEEVKRRTAEMAAKQEQHREAHKEAVRALEDSLLTKEQEQRDRAAQEIRSARNELRSGYGARLDELTIRQGQELSAFDAAQESLGGRVANTWQALRTREWLDDIRTSPLNAMTQAFSLALSSGLQRRQIEELHSREQQRLRREREQSEQDAARRLRQAMHERTAHDRRAFETDRALLLSKQQIEADRQKTRWNELQRLRDAALEPSEPSSSRKLAPDIGEDFSQAAEQSGAKSGGDADTMTRAQEAAFDEVMGHYDDNREADIRDRDIDRE